MKRTFILLLISIVSFSIAIAAVYEVKISDLPDASQMVIASHFSSESIKKVTHNTKKKTYSVTFKGNKNILFAHSGEWICIDCGSNPIPLLLVPSLIRSKIVRAYGYEARAIKITRYERHTYVVLNNGIELTIKSDTSF